jgi:hypothetical protein
MNDPKLVYICGPMRGYPLFNFPAFDEAEWRMRELGFNVLSPAAMDREEGFDPATGIADDALLLTCAKRDIDAIFQCDLIVRLDGWEGSVGANAELGVARWIKKPIADFRDYRVL